MEKETAIFIVIKFLKQYEIDQWINLNFLVYLLKLLIMRSTELHLSLRIIFEVIFHTIYAFFPYLLLDCSLDNYFQENLIVS